MPSTTIYIVIMIAALVLSGIVNILLYRAWGTVGDHLLEMENAYDEAREAADELRRNMAPALRALRGMEREAIQGGHPVMETRLRVGPQMHVTGSDKALQHMRNVVFAADLLYVRSLDATQTGEVADKLEEAVKLYAQARGPVPVPVNGTNNRKATTTDKWIE